MNKLVEMHNVNVTIAGHCALKNINFTLHNAEHVSLQGRNGSGKSTLLKLLRGEISQDLHSDSEIIWHTQGGLERSALMGQKMSALVSTAQLENYIQKGWQISVQDLILTGFYDNFLLYKEPSAAEKETVLNLAKDFNIIGLLDKTVPILSHGQLRIALLARACIRQPQILLLDEFTDGLDKRTRQRIGNIIEIIGQSSTIMAVAHRVETLPDCIKRELCLEDGMIISDGVRKSFVSKKDEVLPVLRQSENKNNGSSLLIDICNADVYVNETHILHQINWQIKHGEHWAIIGENGAGKSTLLKLLAGFENVMLGGYIHRYLPGQGEGLIVEMEKMRRGISLVSDKIQADYWYDLNGEDLVLSGFERSVGLFREITKQERYIACDWMQRFGVFELAKRKMRSLSTGQLRKLMLARAMVAAPDLVLLDEPCSGLDAASRSQFLRMLQDLSYGGTSLVMVTHHEGDIIPEIENIGYLKEGRLAFTKE